MINLNLAAFVLAAVRPNLYPGICPNCGFNILHVLSLKIGVGAARLKREGGGGWEQVSRCEERLRPPADSRVLLVSCGLRPAPQAAFDVDASRLDYRGPGTQQSDPPIPPASHCMFLQPPRRRITIRIKSCVEVLIFFKRGLFSRTRLRRLIICRLRFSHHSAACFFWGL